MVEMTIEMPEGALAALRQDPRGFVQEMRLAAAVKWYEMQLLSQGRAAEVAGVSRSEFIDPGTVQGLALPIERRRDHCRGPG